ncbi:Protein of unknown function [Paraburkholderia susongensis]|uniref:DUF2946 domain-containing protein n=2 Tax=Paraburkholderia susongensis TaxID=1515439 RepID=A0A1X7J0K3_9BURK|nr:DUF2946 domain-containing protein [Paraburkholderia susongensis]SMG20991.1 Protein of unknown function [Paraburkholderia susongensis]
MFNRLHLKIGSWLGLAAILMAALAPTISHTLAAHVDDAVMSAALCRAASMDATDAMDDMSAMQSTSPMRMQMPAQDAAPQDTHATADTADAADTPAAPGDSPSKHTQMSDGDACGYCSLLAHLPVMPSVETLFVTAVRARQQSATARFESVRRVAPLTFAQPRAPPFTS